MIRIDKSKRILLVIMGVLTVVAIVVAQRYYGDKNSSVDPRIVPARKLYEKYNGFAMENQPDSIFHLMDTIESIYSSVEHYATSFEVGVLYNNRAAAWLTMGLFGDFYDTEARDSLVALADSAVRESITIYENWNDLYGEISDGQEENFIEESFLQGLESYPEDYQDQFIQSRIQEITEAQQEIDRRISVSYTNLGMVHRYRENYDSAAICYQYALELWDRNLTAENNLNILLGRPLKKRNFIQRMFPPDRL
ncbi:MAG: tetratricopeptide repeat protein [Bacteroidales bacterium]